MIKFDYKDFDIVPEIDTGNDDFVYGNYVDWDTFRTEREKDLLDYFDIYLPWDQNISLFKYVDFIRQEVFVEFPTILEKSDLNDLPIEKDGDSISDIYIQFPSRDKGIISKIFDSLGVPSGTKYEYELPTDLQYWHNMLRDDYEENEYLFYKMYPIEFATFQDTINDIKSKIKTTPDHLIKKSLILSSMIITESLLKSVIVKKIPKEINISEFSKKILDSEINKKLRSSVDSRNGLFKSLFNKKPPRQGWVNLRNFLAHDIEASTIDDDKIVFSRLHDNREETYIIDDLFKEELDFYAELQKIIDEDGDITE